jgi:molybdopterin molybdotransferase
MLSVDEALKLVLEHARPIPAREVPTAEAQGLVLAEPITSDIDSPPHDKSIVDGYAVISADIMAPGQELLVLEEITAGTVPTRTVEPGTATRIMTGAPLPSGADAVVMVEQTALAGDRVRIGQSPVRVGQNIMRRAASLARGQVVLAAGKFLRGIEIGLLAEVGQTRVAVLPAARVAILATGNELVTVDQIPAAGQIRNSNGPLLAGLARQSGAEQLELGIARDERVDLMAKVTLGVAHDILMLSGGVSAGVLDLVPQVLAELGVEQVFHKVNLKPGKPLWFGVKRHPENGRQTLVFGLPGNPVSGLVCFELFVRPAIQKLSGRDPVGLPRVSAKLTQDHQQRGERPTYWPARMDLADPSVPHVTPLPWKGSGDLRTLSDANCLALFPAGDRTFQAGELVTVLELPT